MDTGNTVNSGGTEQSGTAAPPAVTAFLGMRRIAAGTVEEVALAAKRAMEAETLDTLNALLVFDDHTGHQIELDLRGSEDEVRKRVEAKVPAAGMAPNPVEEKQEEKQPGPGRPRLGVVAREVTLLPRHWDWLNGQTGGASVALRKLVEEARRAAAGKDRIRQSQEAAYRFLSAIAGDLPGFEEATRSLFAGASERFDTFTSDWPADIRIYAKGLAAEALPRGAVGPAGEAGTQ